MEDLGDPTSYRTLGKGAEVYSRDGAKLGEVEHVLADPDADIFDGIVLDTSLLPGGHRFVDARQVDEIFERGVLLRLDRAAAQMLPEPSENPAALEVTADDVAERDERAEAKAAARLGSHLGEGLGASTVAASGSVSGTTQAEPSE